MLDCTALDSIVLAGSSGVTTGKRKARSKKCRIVHASGREDRVLNQLPRAHDKQFDQG
jgi:hypothetical protein